MHASSCVLADLFGIFMLDLNYMDYIILQNSCL